MRTAPVSFVISGRPSVSTCKHRPGWTDFRESWYWRLVRKSVEKQLILLKSEHDIGHFAWRSKYILCCWHQHEVFCNSTAVQREPKVALPWQHSDALYCWQLHSGQQQNTGSVLLRVHGNGGYANASQYHVTCTLPTSFLPEIIVTVIRSCKRKCAYMWCGVWFSCVNNIVYS